MDCLRIEGGVDHPEERHDVGVHVTNAADFEDVLVDVEYVQLILPDAHAPQLAHFPASPLQKLQRRIQCARIIVVSCKRGSHASSFSALETRASSKRR